MILDSIINVFHHLNSSLTLYNSLKYQLVVSLTSDSKILYFGKITKSHENFIQGRTIPFMYPLFLTTSFLVISLCNRQTLLSISKKPSFLPINFVNASEIQTFSFRCNNESVRSNFSSSSTSHAQNFHFANFLSLLEGLKRLYRIQNSGKESYLIFSNLWIIKNRLGRLKDLAFVIIKV